ncbi:MAG: DUF4159 domain-containing protein [Balneolaceae bacterium]|nr:DUF4159 domain-containing protein [Balneolaceae bacterium]
MYKKLFYSVLLIFLMFPSTYLFAQNDDGFKIARVQYRGGGDWYNVPSSLTNLIEFTKNRVPISINAEYDDVQLGSRDIFNYPFLFMTGHGNITVNDAEMENLRTYLENGGFLYVDDDYGMDQYVREILQNIFPEERFFELPANHPIYSNVYNFPDGRPPKVHEHDGEPPQAFAVYKNGRMVLLYTYESNPSDGWAFDEFDNPQDVTDAALQFGVNLLVYALTNP